MTVEAGATLAWQSNANFMVINRGSQLFAVGAADAPITFTSLSDVNGTVGAEDVQQWGGMVIDGFGVTNKCAYTGTRGVDLALAGECHVASEGSAGLDENYYGGVNDADSSGRMEYVVVKHTGATVGNGDELNGITFGAVGSNTIVRNLEVYSVFDDGIEFFGGAVNVTNYAAVYVNDDSIDIDEGWNGTVDTALVIQSATDGNHCVEADGIGSYSGFAEAEISDFIARGLHSQANLINLTCIVSPNGANDATHDPGAGLRLQGASSPTLRTCWWSRASLTMTPIATARLARKTTTAIIASGPQDFGTQTTVSGGLFACEDPVKDDGAAVAAANDIQFATITAATNPTAPTRTPTWCSSRARRRSSPSPSRTWWWTTRRRRSP